MFKRFLFALLLIPALAYAQSQPASYGSSGGSGGGYTINWGAGLSVTSGSTGGSCTGPSACTPFATYPLKTYTTATTLLTGDNANLILGNSASALTLTLPNGQTTNWTASICNQGAGTLTVAAAAGTFYPTASPSLTTGQCASATFDGTNWAIFISGGSGGSGTPCTTTALSVQYNNAGAFGCVSGVTSNGTLMTFANGDLSISGATSGNLLVECTATCGTNTTVTFPANTGNGVSTTGTLVSGDCVQFSGTAGVVADAGGICSAASSSGVLPSYIASNWYPTVPATLAAGATALTAATIYAVPFYLPTKLTISNVGLRATTVGTSTVQQALYASNSTTNRPTGAALCTTTAINPVNTSLANAITAACATSSLSPGMYWCETMQNDSAGKYSSPLITSTPMGWLVGSATANNVLASTSDSLGALTLSTTFGTWPTETSSSFTETATSNAPACIFEVSSVP